MKRFIYHILARIPGVRFWVGRRIFLGPNHNTHRFLGVFPTMAEARAHVPPEFNMGFDEPNVSSDFSTEISERDTDVVRVLEGILPSAKTLFDFGGNIGMCFYQYRLRIPYPWDFRWTVCDVASVCENGRRIAAERGETQVVFTDQPQAADGMDIFLTNGALQYLEESLATQLSKLHSKPQHVLVNRVPMTEKREFFMLQHMGISIVPYHLVNITDFIHAMEKLGYTLVERWQNDRSCEIILRPDRHIPHYYGFYFRKDS